MPPQEVKKAVIVIMVRAATWFSRQVERRRRRRCVTSANHGGAGGAGTEWDAESWFGRGGGGAPNTKLGSPTGSGGYGAAAAAAAGGAPSGSRGLIVITLHAWPVTPPCGQCRQRDGGREPHDQRADLPLNITGGTPTRVAVSTAASHGAATASGTSITCTPTSNYNGIGQLPIYRHQHRWDIDCRDGHRSPCSPPAIASPMMIRAIASGLHLP